MKYSAMKSSSIRETFLKYFEKHGHMRVKSSSLVPQNDPTLFFTNAGMVQFKETFLGQEKRPYKRACSSQKCMRVSGKHNDLENVGHTPRHHTFFEMLGNFSFGDYFKKDAIAFAWEFLTKEVRLDPKKMCVTVFEEDDEAEKFWKKHVAAESIFRLGEKDNFWAMGDTGPCGPCSEILWDFRSGPVKKEDMDSDRFMEIWNLVFMQFERTGHGKVTKLAAPSIDTGMGLERLSAVMQGVGSNWETDLFVPVINAAAEILHVKKNTDTLTALRVIADHIRGSVFLVADGVIPSNEGRGYVLRRIMRRAIRYGKRLGRNEPFLSQLVGVIVDEMGGFYPELAVHERFIEKVVAAEDERFFATLEDGLKLLKTELSAAKGKIISGDVAFKLYDTFGFPLDVTMQIATEEGYKVDEEGFLQNMEKQRERARANWKGSGEKAVESVYKDIAAKGVRTKFIGYEKECTDAKVLAIIKNGREAKDAGDGDEVSFVTDFTPFYGESGGQVGDTGIAVTPGLDIEISDTKKPLADVTVHAGKIKRGKLSAGMKLTLAIDSEKRQRTRCNHTATHILHRKLREVLGEHVKQAGSLVSPERLRFDFSHFQAMTPEEIREVERGANAAIFKDLKVNVREMKYDAAVAEGALAFFGDKYGDEVRMIVVEGFSRELCGGTHVKATGEIGILKIVSESSVAAGVRRIEAVTSFGACAHIEKMEDERREIARVFKTQPSEILARAKKAADDVVRLEKELKNAKQGVASAFVPDLMANVREVSGIKLIAAKVKAADREVLAALAEKYRDKLGEGVVALGSVIDGKVVFIVAVSKALTGRAHAGKIVQALSEKVGGKGGGRPDFAQGGGTDVSKLEEALNSISSF